MNDEKRTRVLLVDDEEEFASTLAERLTLRGFEVSVAAGGNRALEFLRDAEVEVLIIDIMMPGMNGMELLRRVKDMRPWVEALLLTGKGATREGIEGMKLGAFDYITKPVDIEHLVEKINNAAKKSLRNPRVSDDTK